MLNQNSYSCSLRIEDEIYNIENQEQLDNVQNINLKYSTYIVVEKTITNPSQSCKSWS